jgi:hypothetical protein
MSEVNEMDLSEVALKIQNLPDNYFKSLNLDDSGLIEYHKSLKRQYFYHYLWLEFYLLNNRRLYPYLQEGNAGLYKPLGEQTFIIHTFLKEISVLSDFFQKNDIHFWVWGIEHEIFQTTIKNTMYVDKTNGKRKIETDMRNQSKRFEDVDKIQFLGFKKTHSYQEMMMNEAIYIAKNSDNYVFRGKYRRFLADITRIQNELRKSPLPVAYLNKSGEFKSLIPKRKSLKI